MATHRPIGKIITITFEISGDTRAGKLSCYSGHVSHTIDTNSGMYRLIRAIDLSALARTGFVLTWANVVVVVVVVAETVSIYRSSSTNAHT